jgi:4-hydroxy-tetrahydrodipicolinate synthase
MIKGSIVAIVSPMHEDGTLDFDAYRRLIDWHIAEGTNAIVAVGTTGESPTVDPGEHGELIKVAVQTARGRVPIIAGTGGNSTSEAVELTAHAKSVGANATLQVVPYYNKPPQEGLVRHFTVLAEATSLPCILYNIPGRTSLNMTAETTLRLARHPRIVGIKEASGDLQQIGRIIDGAPAGFEVWSGNDTDTLAVMALGGYGVVSVAGHLVGRQIREMISACCSGSSVAASIHHRLMPLVDALFIESNPIAVKQALAEAGFPVGPPRLPLTPATDRTIEVLRAALASQTIDLPVPQPAR